MKKRLILLIIFILTTAYLVGCEDPAENNETSLDIYDFALIQKAPDTIKKQDINKVIKIYLSENDSSLSNGYAVDIENEYVLINPIMSIRGVRTTIEAPVHIGDTMHIIDILEKYNIQNWKTDYTFEDPSTYEDGYGWQLWLQFEDGSVEKHGGSGTDIDKITPENFNEFIKEFSDAIEEKINHN